MVEVTAHRAALALEAEVVALVAMLQAALAAVRLGF
jgi:hypothetical protein